MVKNSRFKPSVIITGTSSGIGKASVIYFAKRGWQVIATVRKTSELNTFGSRENIVTRKLNVTKAADIEHTFNWLEQNNYQLAAVINNAGFGLYGPFEGTGLDQIEAVYKVNVLGLMAVTKAAIAHMRQREGGNIVNISSIGGCANLPYYATYGSTKAAVESFTEGVQAEVSPFGIRLKIIEPGGVSTNFFTKALKRTEVPGQYTKTEGKSERLIRRFSFAETPEKVARVIYKAANSQSNRLRYQTSIFIRLTIFGRRFLPDRLYQFILRQFFA